MPLRIFSSALLSGSFNRRLSGSSRPVNGLNTTDPKWLWRSQGQTMAKVSATSHSYSHPADAFGMYQGQYERWVSLIDTVQQQRVQRDLGLPAAVQLQRQESLQQAPPGEQRNLAERLQQQVERNSALEQRNAQLESLCQQLMAEKAALEHRCTAANNRAQGLAVELDHQSKTFECNLQKLTTISAKCQEAEDRSTALQLAMDRRSIKADRMKIIMERKVERAEEEIARLERVAEKCKLASNRCMRTQEEEHGREYKALLTEFERSRAECAAAKEELKASQQEVAMLCEDTASCVHKLESELMRTQEALRLQQSTQQESPVSNMTWYI